MVKTYKNNRIVKIEDDRNFDGKVDLVQEYARGVLVREVRDDDFDGKPEAIKTFRPNGTLAIVERDPQERGYIDIVEYYDASGKLTNTPRTAQGVINPYSGRLTTNHFPPMRDQYSPIPQGRP